MVENIFSGTTAVQYITIRWDELLKKALLHVQFIIFLYKKSSFFPYRLCDSCQVFEEILTRVVLNISNKHWCSFFIITVAKSESQNNRYGAYYLKTAALSPSFTYGSISPQVLYNRVKARECSRIHGFLCRIISVKKKTKLVTSCKICSRFTRLLQAYLFWPNTWLDKSSYRF